MCNVVQASGCRRDFSATQSMVCQGRSDGEAYSLADYNPFTQNWTETSNTIQVVVGSGELCGAIGNQPRRTNVTFICDPSYTTRTGNDTGIISFSESSTCFYALTIVANSIVCPYFNRSGTNITLPVSSSSSSSTGGIQPGTNCLTPATAPAGSAAFSLVFNSPLANLPADFLTTVMNALMGAISSNQLVCGQVISGDRTANSLDNTTAAQTIVTIYVVQGAATVSSVHTKLFNALTKAPIVITSRLPAGFPVLVPDSYLNIVCAPDQYVDVRTQDVFLKQVLMMILPVVYLMEQLLVL